MTDYSWEEENIRIIIKTVDSYLKEKNFFLKEIVKNSRDGGYVAYAHKSRLSEIRFCFLPHYEVEIHYHQKLLKSLISAIVKKGNSAAKIKYMTQEMNFDLPLNSIEEFKIFIKKSLRYMQKYEKYT